MLKQFGRWLENRRHFLFSWYTEDSEEAQEPELSLIALPSQVQDKLLHLIEQLPLCAADQDAVTEALDEAYSRWRANPQNTNNSIVILSSPVTAVFRILSETIEAWAQQKQVTLRLFPLAARPPAIISIKSKLEHYLVSKSSQGDSEAEEIEIVVIPNLSWCFLRSLEGLEGIEYLQYLLCHGSKNRFWIVGGSQVSWQYLNSVCSLEAYCGQIFTLPKITPEHLQQWLSPIIEELEIVYDEPRLDKKILDGDKDNQEIYFDRLADISDGVSTVAVQGFLKSIAWAEETDNQQAHLVAQTPKLPKLADLSNPEQYLLYSLLLHGDLTIAALAQSLGDDESEVQAIVRMLQRKGIIEHHDQVLKINPIHYPKLKYELGINNFVI